MFYFKWNEDDLQGLQSVTGMVLLYTEVDSDGNILREIGLDKSGRILHKFPSNSYPHGKYGLFDNQRVKVPDLQSTAIKEEFDKLWQREEK